MVKIELKRFKGNINTFLPNRIICIGIISGTTIGLLGIDTLSGMLTKESETALRKNGIKDYILTSGDKSLQSIIRSKY